MKKLRSSPLELSSNLMGFSIVDVNNLTSFATELVLRHIQETLEEKFDSLDTAAKFIVENEFSRFKDKSARIFPQFLARKFVDYIERYGFLNIANCDFVTDEEGLGYENIYWRIVRGGSPSDVGQIHADKWFWELNEDFFPASHTRVKVWMPLIQDDENPSLTVLPGSHKKDFNYDYHIDSHGKKRPRFLPDSGNFHLVAAPVTVGKAIVFHDSLLHGGRSTSTYE